jgi:hypothetical protein
MEVSGELNVLAAFTPGKEKRYSLNTGQGGPQSRCVDVLHTHTFLIIQQVDAEGSWDE